MEFAGNPSKMSKILASFNGANLGEVTNAGVMEDAENEAQTILNNFRAGEAVADIAYKEDASKLGIDSRAQAASMQRGADRFGAITSGITSIAGGAMRGSDFSLFGNKGTDLSNVDTNSSAFKVGTQEGNSYFGSRI